MVIYANHKYIYIYTYDNANVNANHIKTSNYIVMITC